MTLGSARFIVVEGIDGSGTSTQAAAIHAALVHRGLPACLTHEPSDGPVGKLIRDLLSGRSGLACDDDAGRQVFALLFAADRKQHLEARPDGIRSRLAAGSHVVCARYVLSSLAYEADAPDERLSVAALNRAFPIPDLTVYLRCPVEVALGRIRATRATVDLFENRAKLERVAANYERLVKECGGGLVVADATGPAAGITERVLEALDRL